MAKTPRKPDDPVSGPVAAATDAGTAAVDAAARPLPPVVETPPAPAALVVRSRPPQRRRAGRAFSREPVRIAVAELSEADRAAIEADPELIVTLAED
ncbi:hypothetical protein [Blastochloris tepida]|uniref:Mu-like prophage FluMu N-terminal domain-containing protein n=1 Tax=Blastochloris tepida TaxID=2233851 RepID=A0A348FYI1_9HYPH|nr:hypothetical protein [Blastochloris tepida]BBF92364.1 hypothetical protein BLTE_10490 [Blastochloris tepida]